MKWTGSMLLIVGLSMARVYGQDVVVHDLEDCVRSGLRRNLALHNLSLDILHAENNVDLARSVYDEGVSGFATYEDSELPNQAVPVQGATKSLVLGGGLSRRLSTGTGLRLSASSARIDFAETLSPVNPLHISAVTLDIEQPLWGGGGTEDQARIQLAESVRDTVALEFYVQQDQVAAGIEHAYWLGFLARSQYQVNQDVLQRARELLSTNRIRFDEGLLDETDILAAEAALALSEVDVINLSNACVIAEDLLRERMNVTPEEWDEIAFRYPGIAALDVIEPAGTAAGAEAVARTHRPEIFVLRAMAQRAADEIDLREEEIKGDFGVTGQVGAGESAGDWAGSLDPAKAVWGIGLSYESSLGRDAERSRLRQAELEARRVENQHQHALRTITWQIRRAARSLETSVHRVAATEKARDLQQRKLALERRNFDQGRSDTRTVIEYQDDLAFAEFQSVQALVRYRRALIDLRLAEGTIVDKPALWSGDWQTAREWLP